MKSKVTVVSLLCALALSPFVANAQGSRIQLSQIEAMFANMRAKAPWNVDGPLLWGYFFFDPNREKLERAAKELQASGYKLVAISEVQGQQRYRLHVERVEVHSPTSLNARNVELYALADRLSISSYDGMDVGPAK